MTSTQKIVIIITLVINSSVIAIAGLYAYKLAVKDMNQYKEDMKCIHVLVRRGVERKDIALENGVCVVEEDIYYKSLNK